MATESRNTSTRCEEMEISLSHMLKIIRHLLASEKPEEVERICRQIETNSGDTRWWEPLIEQCDPHAQREDCTVILGFDHSELTGDRRRVAFIWEGRGPVDPRIHLKFYLKSGKAAVYWNTGSPHTSMLKFKPPVGFWEQLGLVQPEVTSSAE
jgi:hypothetical protein